MAAGKAREPTSRERKQVNELQEWQARVRAGCGCLEARRWTVCQWWSERALRSMSMRYAWYDMRVGTHDA